MLTLIAAAAENNALGKDNDLVWHLPDDFKRFKRLTSGHHIIMGRKTFESFPKLLPDRTHIVITRKKKTINRKVSSWSILWKKPSGRQNWMNKPLLLVAVRFTKWA